MPAPVAKPQSFEPPGPGSWEIDGVHFPRPSPLYEQEVRPAPFKRGVQEFTRFYGMLIDGLEYRYVNGFAYKAVVPIDPKDVPARLQRAEEVFKGRLWREQLQDWDTRVKPAAIAAHRALQAVDPDALSDAALGAYLARCRDHHAAMITQHMRFTAGAIVPTGDFVAQVGKWSGVKAGELLGLLRGSAPVSAGGSDELSRMRAAVAKDARAMALLHSSDDPATVLAGLRTLGGEAGPAVAAYLDLIGNRLLDGFDIAEPTALELPDVLLRAIRVAVDEPAGKDADLDAREAAIRAKVPEAQRAAFDELLAEARLTYRLRDERGVYSDIWAAGIMRRAVLAAGRRIAAAGRIKEAGHLVHAGFEEMNALLAGGGGPSADDLAARAAFRAANRSKDMPQLLGPPEPPPPDFSTLPPAGARMMAAVGVALGMLFGSSAAAHTKQTLRGLAASRGTYEGPARRISSPAEFDRIVKGDVLVTESTTEAFNILLPLLGAIVTDSGGLLSHSAIVAREYGIPGVVGTREATRRIADGVRVRVDGERGEVTVLG